MAANELRLKKPKAPSERMTNVEWGSGNALQTVTWKSHTYLRSYISTYKHERNVDIQHFIKRLHNTNKQYFEGYTRNGFGREMNTLPLALKVAGCVVIIFFILLFVFCFVFGGFIKFQRAPHFLTSVFQFLFF